MDRSPRPRQSFSERHGRGPRAQPLPFAAIRRHVVKIFDDLRYRGYFQQAFGYDCVDAGAVEGELGADPDAYFFRTITRESIWPYWEPELEATTFIPVNYEPDSIWESWDADTLFDVIEVLHDLVSKPTDGRHHDYNNCGWHYTEFNRTEGQEEFRRAVNGVLPMNDPPYEIGGLGQVVEAAPEEFHQLLSAAVPVGTEHDLITSKVDAAVTRFRARGASIDDRRHAVRDLADVLEALRGDIKESMLTADERALFHIANGFAIRHNTRAQRGDYDRVTWLRWAFYVYLATIHAVLRVRNAHRGAA